MSPETIERLRVMDGSIMLMEADLLAMKEFRQIIIDSDSRNDA